MRYTLLLEDLVRPGRTTDVLSLTEDAIDVMTVPQLEVRPPLSPVCLAVSPLITAVLPQVALRKCGQSTMGTKPLLDQRLRMSLTTLRANLAFAERVSPCVVPRVALCSCPS